MNATAECNLTEQQKEEAHEHLAIAAKSLFECGMSLEEIQRHVKYAVDESIEYNANLKRNLLVTGLKSVGFKIVGSQLHNDSPEGDIELVVQDGGGRTDDLYFAFDGWTCYQADFKRYLVGDIRDTETFVATLKRFYNEGQQALTPAPR